MKIDRVQLGELLLSTSLYQYSNVPAEEEIDHSFRESFCERMRAVAKKSESPVWRVWQAPLKRAILLAVLVALMLAAIACAVPAVRKAMIAYFIVDHGESYGITFDPVAAANAPRVVEEYYAPTYAPEGYELLIEDYSVHGVEYVWVNEADEYIAYDQKSIPEDATSDTWFRINAEETERTTKLINGYLVEIITSEGRQQYQAIWTDNRYLYMVDISIFEGDQEPILLAIMSSIVEVEKNN